MRLFVGVARFELTILARSAPRETGILSFGFLVGAARFELTISWSQTKRDTGLRYAPNFQILHILPFKIPGGVYPELVSGLRPEKK